MATDRTLLQFPISHFCEKARWVLDVKGLAYRTRNLIPGPHRLVTARYPGCSSVPVLIEGTRALGDSVTIAHTLDAEHPTPRLLPEAPEARARAIALETYFGTKAGPRVRGWIYGQLLQVRGAAPRVFFHGYGRVVQALAPALHPAFEFLLRRTTRTDRASLDRAHAALMEVVARLEDEIDGDPTRYLVGASLSVADVSAASLLGPLVGPPGSPWAVRGEVDAAAPALHAFRDELRARPAGQWVLQRYQFDRGRTAQA